MPELAQTGCVCPETNFGTMPSCCRGSCVREGTHWLLLQVVGSRPDTVVDNFFTLMPQGAAADFQRIIDLKVDAAVIELHLQHWAPACSTCSGYIQASYGTAMRSCLGVPDDCCWQHLSCRQAVLWPPSQRALHQSSAPTLPD